MTMDDSAKLATPRHLLDMTEEPRHQVSGDVICSTAVVARVDIRFALAIRDQRTDEAEDIAQP
jgi:hypothetical protein